MSSEQRRNPKKASRNMLSRVRSVRGDRYPARRVVKHFCSESEVSGWRPGGTGASLRWSPRSNMMIWG